MMIAQFCYIIPPARFIFQSGNRKYYGSWIELVKKGVLKQNNIGFAMWEFSGDFGLINSGRADVSYENWHGQKLDGKLLKLLIRN